MTLQMGRIWAESVEDALEQIHLKHGPGTVSLKAFRLNADGQTWFEYVISLDGDLFAEV